MTQFKLPLIVRLINQFGITLNRLRIFPVSIGAEMLLADAQKQTGLSDWGGEEFRTGLKVLLDSLEKESGLSLLGRIIIKKNLTRLLANRLRIQEDFKRNPEILDQPVPKPLFIIGLPRTGTTLLYNLLAQDPNVRTPLLWELFQPSPPPEKETRQTDPRIEIVRKRYQQMDRLIPQMRSIHHMNPTSPDECVLLFQNIFSSHIFSWTYNVPKYTEWLLQYDMIPAYRYYRQLLQLLQWKTPGAPWVLKSPHHLYHLNALLTVFPDACLIQTHRHPAKVVGSFCSLVTTMRRVNSGNVDPLYIGKTQLEGLATGTDRAMQFRKAAKPSQFYDVHFHDLVSNPISVIEKIYAHFNYRFTDDFEAAMKRWIEGNPQHKHGVHSYSLEQFGLNSTKIRQQFSNYIEYFDITSGD